MKKWGMIGLAVLLLALCGCAKPIQPSDEPKPANVQKETAPAQTALERFYALAVLPEAELDRSFAGRCAGAQSAQSSCR